MAAIFADNILKHNFVDENVQLLIKISLNIIPYGPIENNPALVQIMACHQIGDKPLSEPVMVLFGDAYMCLSDELTDCWWIKFSLFFFPIMISYHIIYEFTYWLTVAYRQHMSDLAQHWFKK